MADIKEKKYNRDDSLMRAPVMRYAYENEVEQMKTLNSRSYRPRIMVSNQDNLAHAQYATLPRNTKAKPFIELEEVTDHFEPNTRSRTSIQLEDETVTDFGMAEM